MLISESPSSTSVALIISSAIFLELASSVSMSSKTNEKRLRHASSRLFTGISRAYEIERNYVKITSFMSTMLLRRNRRERIPFNNTLRSSLIILESSAT